MSDPDIGHPIHYVAYGTPGGEYQSLCRAAIVAAHYPDEEATAIVVFNPTGLFFNTVRYDAAKAPGTWHYACSRQSLTGVVQPDGSTITAQEK